MSRVAIVPGWGTASRRGACVRTLRLAAADAMEANVLSCQVGRVTGRRVDAEAQIAVVRQAENRDAEAG